MFILASSVCKTLQCLISPLTLGGKGDHLLRLTCSVVLWGGRDTAKQIPLACVGNAHSGWTTLSLPQPKAACASWVYTARFPQCSARALSQVDPAFHALPRSKPLRFLGALQGHRPRLAVVLCPSQVQAAQPTWCLVSTLYQVGHVSYAPPWSWPLGFLVAPRGHSPRCAVCLLWGADLRL